jgi:hypothetical protein
MVGSFRAVALAVGLVAGFLSAGCRPGAALAAATAPGISTAPAPTRPCSKRFGDVSNRALS